MKASFRIALLMVLLPALAQAYVREPKPTVGIEGHASVILPRDDYAPLPVDERAPVITRVDGIVPVEGEGFRYELFFLGLEPGVYPLSQLLLRADGKPADELQDQTVTVSSVLPLDHDGRLTLEARARTPGLPGYRAGLVALALVWVAGLGMLAYLNRRRRIPPPAPPIPPPTLAELLRPMAEAAASGTLDAQGRARLERLLIGFWSARLGVESLPAGEVLPRLKAHPEAGALLHAVETWLHSPRGATAEEVRRVLEPYARVPAPSTEPTGP